MNYILFDGNVRNQLLPFTFTRPVADIRVGILTIREKWEHFLGFTTTTVTEDYLSEKFPFLEMEKNILINASFLPAEKLVNIIKGLQENQAVFFEDEPIAFFTLEGQEVDFDTFKIIQSLRAIGGLFDFGFMIADCRLLINIELGILY